jgi:hypothetical protein
LPVVYRDFATGRGGGGATARSEQVKKQDLVGAWRYENEHPQGLFIILPNGWYSHIIMRDDLPRYSSGVNGGLAICLPGTRQQHQSRRFGWRFSGMPRYRAQQRTRARRRSRRDLSTGGSLAFNAQSLMDPHADWRQPSRELTRSNWRQTIPKRRKPTNARMCECGLTCFAPTTLWWVAIVDAEDAWLLQRWKWSASGRSRDRTFYAKSTTYWKDTGKSDRLHQAVTGHIHQLVDHRNRNGHDNRKANLRPCTDTESARNKGKRSFVKAASSRYIGVNKLHERRWEARIMVDARRMRLGYFGLETDAAIAYNYHAAHLHGEFARFNDMSGIVYQHD